MKEAAGEANMTVVTIILIGIVLAIGTLIVNSVMQRIGDQANDATQSEVNTNNPNSTYNNPFGG